jgi:hypothetical protein
VAWLNAHSSTKEAGKQWLLVIFFAALFLAFIIFY